MEKGDIYGIIGMALGIGAITDIVLYFIYSNIPLFQSMWWVFMGIFYAMIYGGGPVAVILSIIGISKNKSKFGIIGLITAASAIVIFTIVLLS